MKDDLEKDPTIASPEIGQPLNLPETAENRSAGEYADGAAKSVETLAVDTSDTLRTTETEAMSRASQESGLSTEEVEEVKTTQGIDSKFASISERTSSAARKTKEKILSVLPGRKQETTEGNSADTEKSNVLKFESKENKEAIEKRKEIIEKAGEKRDGTMRKTLDKIQAYCKEHNISEKIDLIPIAGEISMLAKGILGKDYLTGEKLTRRERLMNTVVGGASALAWAVPGAGEFAEGGKDAIVLGREGAVAAGLVGKTTGYAERIGSKLVAQEAPKAKSFGKVVTTIAGFMRRHKTEVEWAENRAASLVEKQLKDHPRRVARERLGINEDVEKAA